MSRKNTRDLIAEIYADSGADLDELARLRDRVDEVQSEVVEQEESDGIVVATGKAFEIIRILVEEGVVKTRHRTQGPVDHSPLRSIVAANIAYLRATLEALPGQTPPQ